jgi:hypothetical protein
MKYSLSFPDHMIARREESNTVLSQRNFCVPIVTFSLGVILFHSAVSIWPKRSRHKNHNLILVKMASKELAIRSENTTRISHIFIIRPSFKQIFRIRPPRIVSSESCEWYCRCWYAHKMITKRILLDNRSYIAKIDSLREKGDPETFCTLYIRHEWFGFKIDRLLRKY